MTANKNTFDSYRIIEESMMAAGAEAVAAGSPLSSADPRIFLSRMSGRQKLGLMLAVSVIIALLAGGWMWRQAPDYKVLFSNISGHDGGAIIASLQQMNVPYQYADGGGAILVPARKVHDTRVKLAAEGLPRGGPVGFDQILSIRIESSRRP